ncbi:hypothetical protein DSLASN_02290 [Desulfoluna limicola]|uniref:Uncharacterized protein n=1 Tax=Desulfoluna limicola TaxID=2810562 RepID=A0ABM7PAQ0_9BACT|nr:hypothetical protein [Desulfoluna limicola]BCS94597.1 hypothetical protein DSLASN_02290 [Desulfoluna limicola]
MGNAQENTREVAASVESRPMTDADWDQIKKMMDMPYGQARLMVDGFEVIFQQHIEKRKLITVTYVNGQLKGEWIAAAEDGTCDAKHEEARRFFMPRARSLYSAKEIKAVQRFHGKKEATKCAAKKTYSFTPLWKSANSLRKHLEAHNKEIRVVNITSFA